MSQASEFKRVANNINWEKIKVQYNEIIDKIGEAATKGEYSIQVVVNDSKNDNAIVATLVENDFHIRCLHDYQHSIKLEANQNVILISW